MVGVEGKAGMAVIVSSDPLDLPSLLTSLKAGLPAYALPLFLRTVPAIDTTGRACSVLL